VRYSTTVAPTQQPRSLGDHATADLTFIRSAMERSSAFTAVPGAGGVVTGLIGLSAAVVSARQPTADLNRSSPLRLSDPSFTIFSWGQSRGRSIQTSEQVA